MKKSHNQVIKRLTILWYVGALVIAIVAKKVFDYASPPHKEKECAFTYPDNGGGTPHAITLPSFTDLPIQQKGGAINDASCLNKTSVYGIVSISSTEDVAQALHVARENNLKVTSAGQRHSMGGQSFSAQGLVLDMRQLNQLRIDKENKVLTAQSGATWADIQKFLDHEGLAVKAMQSINIFTVGGTLSVNAHGIAHNPGPIASTVRSLRLMKSDGTIITASPTQNAELFRLALGGYGLFGVILDADIEVVDNETYSWEKTYLDYRDFPEYYRQHIAGHDDIGLMYARLSVAPHAYLTETSIHTYTKNNYQGKIPPLQADKHDWVNRLVINFSKTGNAGRWTRWMLEKYAEPRLHTCISRNQAMSQKEVCVVSRNQEMYDSMGYLKNKLTDTDILQEYFIPQDKMPDFVDGLRQVVKQRGANLLNVTIRIVSEDKITSLPYAKEDMFAFVLYFNQRLNTKDSQILQQTTSELIGVATGLGGTYYLPYQLYYSPAQLRASYPQIDSFFAAKKKHDPLGLFTNKFYEKYGR